MFVGTNAKYNSSPLILSMTRVILLWFTIYHVKAGWLGTAHHCVVKVDSNSFLSAKAAKDQHQLLDLVNYCKDSCHQLNILSCDLKITRDSVVSFCAFSLQRNNFSAASQDVLSG